MKTLLAIENKLLSGEFSPYFDKSSEDMNEHEFFVHNRMLEDELENFVDVKSIVNYFKLNSKSRKRDLVTIRHVFFCVLHKKGTTLEQIGEIFNKDHSTVVHGIKKSQELFLMNDKFFMNIYRKLYDHFYKLKV